MFLGEGWRARQEALWKARPPASTWRRLYDHALGLRHAVQERLHEALPSLERALAEVEASGTGRDRAMVLALLGRLAAHEGRTAEEIERYLDQLHEAYRGF